jgi:hypothetical protein
MHALEVRLAEFVNESRECFKRVNIRNQSKSLQDKYKKYIKLIHALLEGATVLVIHKTTFPFLTQFSIILLFL